MDSKDNTTSLPGSSDTNTLNSVNNNINKPVIDKNTLAADTDDEGFASGQDEPFETALDDDTNNLVFNENQTLGDVEETFSEAKVDFVENEPKISQDKVAENVKLESKNSEDKVVENEKVGSENLDKVVESSEGVESDRLVENKDDEVVVENGVKVTNEGDSVVEEIKVDVPTADPGVAVVIKTDEVVDKVEVTDEVVDDDEDEDVLLVGGPEDDDEVDVVGMDDDVKVNSEVSGADESKTVVESRDLGFDGVSEAKVTPEGDSVVESVDVDLAKPGVTPKDVKEEDSVVEAIDVDLPVAGVPGVAVVMKTEEEGGDVAVVDTEKIDRVLDEVVDKEVVGVTEGKFSPLGDVEVQTKNAKTKKKW